MCCRSSALAAGLSWSSPLPGATVAAQLLSLGRMHSQGAPPTTEVCQMLAALMPQLYRALEVLPPDGAEAAAAVLASKPVVWTGNGFALTDKVAFRYRNYSGMLLNSRIEGCCIIFESRL